MAGDRGALDSWRDDRAPATPADARSRSNGSRRLAAWDAATT